MLDSNYFNKQREQNKPYGLFCVKNTEENSCSSTFSFVVINEKLIVSSSTGGKLTSDILAASKISNTTVDIADTLSTKQQLNNLRKYMNLNISELARILHVQRPAIYDWLEGKAPSHRNQDRLDEIHAICEEWMTKDIGYVGRYMYRKVTADNKSLMELLEEKTLNRQIINNVLDIIATSIRKSRQERIKRDALLKAEEFEEISEEERLTNLLKYSRKIS